MSLTAKIARNTLIQIAGKGVALLFGLASVSMLTRYLGRSGFGEYTTAISFVQFFGTLADLGLYIVTVKKISDAQADVGRIFSNVFTLRIFSSLIFVVAAPLVILLFPYPAPVKMGVAILSVTNLFVQLTLVFTGLYQRALAMFRVSVAEIAGKVVVLGLTATLVLARQPLAWILTAVVAGSFVQCVLTMWFARRYIHLRLAFDFTLWREILHDSWPVALSIALNLIYFRADTIILSLFHPQATVGLYGASYKVLEVLVAFPAMFVGLVTPILAFHASAHDWQQFSATLQKGFDFLATLAIPIVAGVFLLAHPIMTFVAGAEFTASGSILRVLIFAVASIFFGTMFSNSIVAINQQRRMMKYYLIVAVFSLTGYFSLIPKFSVWGAAGMTVATEVSIMISSAFVVWKTARFRLRLTQVLRATVAALAMMAVLYFFQGLPLFASVPLGVGVYVLGMAAIGGVQPKMLREMVGER